LYQTFKHSSEPLGASYIVRYTHHFTGHVEQFCTVQMASLHIMCVPTQKHPSFVCFLPRSLLESKGKHALCGVFQLPSEINA
jgi:hypothetical protein